MTREIKFRVWDKYNKIYYPRIWNVSFLFGGIRFAWDDYENSDGETMITDLTEDLFELMQYTGLKDKNGKEIYEGDIVKDNSTLPHLVVWDSINARFIKSQNNNKCYDWISNLLKDTEIIGNIYENPELLNN